MGQIKHSLRSTGGFKTGEIVPIGDPNIRKGQRHSDVATGQRDVTSW